MGAMSKKKNRKKSSGKQVKTPCGVALENRLGKHVFMSEEASKRTVNQAIEDALHEKCLVDALVQSRNDFKESRFYSTREEMLAAVARKRDAVNAQLGAFRAICSGGFLLRIYRCSACAPSRRTLSLIFL